MLFITSPTQVGHKVPSRPFVPERLSNGPNAHTPMTKPARSISAHDDGVAGSRLAGIAAAGGVALVGVMLWSTLAWRAASLSEPLLDAVSGTEMIGLVAIKVLAGVLFLLVLWALLRMASRSPESSAMGRRALLIVAVVGVGMRLAALPHATGWEDDFHRYLWDGAVVASGENPYRWSPEAVMQGSLDVPTALVDLAATAESTVTSINHAHLRTIYPPVTQFWFAAAHVIAPWQLDGWRLVLLLHDLTTVALLLFLLRRLRLPLVLAGGWWINPLVVSEVFQTVHMDVLALPWVLGAIALAITSRRHLGAIALAVAVAVKLWPLALAPLLLRDSLGSKVSDRVRRTLLAGAIVCVASLVLLAPMLMVERAATDPTASGLVRYAEAWQNNAAFYALHHGVWERALPIFGIEAWESQEYARRATVLLFALLVVALIWRPIVDGRDLCRRAMWIVAALFLIGPTQFPWYFLWVVPLIAVGVDRHARPSWALLAAVALLPMYHFQYVAPWTLWVQHAPIWIWLGVDALRGLREGATERVLGATARDRLPSNMAEASG